MSDAAALGAPPLAGDPAAATGAPAGGGRALLALVRRRRDFAAGYLILATVAALALLAPALTLRSPVDADPTAFLQPPSFAHPMGTDAAGLDVFSRVLHAPRVDLAIALAATLWAASIGGALGAACGLWEGRRGWRRLAAGLIGRAADVLQAFPVFFLALALVAVRGQGVDAIVLAIGTVNIPLFLRLMRSEARRIGAMPYMEAARIAGASDWRLLTRHVAPNAAAPLLAQASVTTASAVLIAAGLSFLGAGVRAPTPEWGSMIAMGFQNIVTGQWWPSIFPGLALALTVFALGRVGASILAVADPRARARPTRAEWAAFRREGRG